jgi:hypothetical protein
VSFVAAAETNRSLDPSRSKSTLSTMTVLKVPGLLRMEEERKRRTEVVHFAAFSFMQCSNAQ